jgi:hypothetical protein
MIKTEEPTDDWLIDRDGEKRRVYQWCDKNGFATTPDKAVGAGARGEDGAWYFIGPFADGSLNKLTEH